MCPGNNITGGKRRSGKTTKGNVWLADILNQCAWAAARSRDTYLSAQYWRLARRIGKKKAAVAVGHSILVICWHLLTNNADYDDLGGDYFARRANTARHQDRLVQQLQDLGYQVTLKKIAAERPPAHSTLILFTDPHGRGPPRWMRIVSGLAELVLPWCGRARLRD